MKQQTIHIIHFLSLKLPVLLSRVSNNFPFYLIKIMIEFIRPKISDSMHLSEESVYDNN